MEEIGLALNDLANTIKELQNKLKNKFRVRAEVALSSKEQVVWGKENGRWALWYKGRDDVYVDLCSVNVIARLSALEHVPRLVDHLYEAQQLQLDKIEKQRQELEELIQALDE